ncbi:MAG TPA: DUF929 family protein, partial [Acidimicrobiales bacterium]|nr:DUF929 family protein [Acidimicrobiales bacterium]
EGGAGPDAPTAEPSRRWGLYRTGLFLTPFFGVWFLLAFFLPSPVGVYIAAIPLLGLLLAISGLVLVLGWRRTSPRWSPYLRLTVVLGVVFGLLFAGGLGLAAVAQGCPRLAPALTSEPAGWLRADNAAWHSGGRPVLYLLASAACPYCSASSWALFAALSRFGNFSGLAFDRSSTTDVDPGTPELVFAHASFASPWVAFHPDEATNDQQIQVPPPASCLEQAYVSAYSGGSIPFVVVNGIFLHTGTLVDPATLAGASAPSVLGQVLNESGPAWDAVAPSADWLIAFLLKSDGGVPSALAASPPVAADLAGIR